MVSIHPDYLLNRLEKERWNKEKIPGPIVLFYRCINNKQTLRHRQEFLILKSVITI